MSTTTTDSIVQKVSAILAEELGEYNEWGDGDRVTDVIVGYADWRDNPPLDDHEPVIVLGDWNPKRFIFNDKDAPPLTDEENLGPRLFERLTEAGADCQWLDQCTRCCECGKAIQTEPNSYSWLPQYVVHDDYTCSACVMENLEDYLHIYVDDFHKAITFCSQADMEELGFETYAPGDPKSYQNGWHEDMNDKPEDVYNEIKERFPEHDVIFMLDATSQFYLDFSAMIRPTNYHD